MEEYLLPVAPTMCVCISDSAQVQAGAVVGFGVGFFPLVEGFERASTVWLVPGISAFHRRIGSQQESSTGDAVGSVACGGAYDSPVLEKFDRSPEQRLKRT
jgi:hypothetical protein